MFLKGVIDGTNFELTDKSLQGEWKIKVIVKVTILDLLNFLSKTK